MYSLRDRTHEFCRAPTEDRLTAVGEGDRSSEIPLLGADANLDPGRGLLRESDPPPLRQ